MPVNKTNERASGWLLNIIIKGIGLPKEEIKMFGMGCYLTVFFDSLSSNFSFDIFFGIDLFIQSNFIFKL